MRFFTVKEVLEALFMYAVLGFGCGVIYKMADTLYFSVYNFIRSFKIADSLSGKNKKSKFKAFFEQPVKRGVMFNIFEFFICLIFGILYTFVTFFKLDGIIRIYVFLVFVAFFFLSKKTAGRYFEKIYIFLFKRILFCLCMVEYFFVKSIRNLLNLLTFFCKNVKIRMKKFNKL